MSASRPRHRVLVVFSKEIREVLRDRRTLFFAFVLPLVLYPVVFLGLSRLSRAHREGLEERPLVIGVHGDAPAILRELWQEDRLETVRMEPEERALREEEVALFIEAEEGPDGRLAVTVHHIETVPASREARARVAEVLERVERTRIEETFAARGVSVDVRGLVRVEEVDVALPEELAAMGIGRFAPALLLLLLMTGGAFAAIDTVAGEKERGTLETLCVQAVSTGEVVAAKFFVVLALSIVSVLLNLVGLLLACALGLASGSADAAGLSLPPLGGILLALAFLAPFSVLASALLLVVSSYARSYREAQTYLLPLTIAVLVPAAMSLAPGVGLSPGLALVPVANVALAMRDALAGGLRLEPAVLVLASTVLYAVLVLRKARDLLGREEVVLAVEGPPLGGDSRAESRERRALLFGAVALLLAFLGSGWLQGSGRFDPVTGTALVLWAVVLPPALLYPLVTRRPFREALALRRPALRSVLLAPVLAVLSSFLMAAYMPLQEEVLPVPSELEKALESLVSIEGIGGMTAFLVFALSPGICEELLWRGAFQGDLEPRGRPVRAVLTVAVFFGIFHASIYRFVPAALVGALLAVVRLRTGSIVPCMVLHTTYNALALFVLGGALAETSGIRDLAGEPAAVLAALGGVAGSLWLLKRRG